VDPGLGTGVPSRVDLCPLRELAKGRYQEAVESARVHHLAEPPPFEDVAEAEATYRRDPRAA